MTGANRSGPVVRPVGTGYAAGHAPWGPVGKVNSPGRKIGGGMYTNTNLFHLDKICT
jgi:hypothetical protein